MEFKGITWAGNIYQKFENMCLEVEEAIYEDTVKYVENQVQKVGLSVKKFCSEVTEDLLPPSCVYPVNLASGDLSLNSYGDINVIKKPIPSMFDCHHDLKKKENEGQVISDPTAERKSSLDGCYDINSLLVPTMPSTPIRKKVEAKKNSIGIKRISRNNNPSNDYCRTNSTSGDRIEPASCDKNLMSTLNLDVRRESEEETEDLLAPTCPYPLASGDLFDCHRDLKKKGSEGQVISDTEKKSSLNDCYDMNSLLVPTMPRTPIRKKVEAKKNSIGIKRISRNNHPSKDHCQTNSTSEDRIELASCDKNLMSTLNLDVWRETEVVGNTSIPDCGLESPASQKPSPVESVGKNKDNLDSTLPAFLSNVLGEPVRLNGDYGSTSSCSGMPSESTGTAANGVSFSMLGSSIRSNTCNLESGVGVIMKSDEGKSMKDESSIVSTATCVADSCEKETLKSGEDEFDMEIIEEDEFAEPGLGKIEREKLDEGCVMVEGDELRNLPQGTKKHMSYKRKIREAVSSKLRSRKDNRHKDSGGKSNDEAVKENGPARDSLESGWELL